MAWVVQGQAANKVEAAGGKAGEEQIGGMREWMSGGGVASRRSGCREEGGNWQDAPGCREGTWKLA